jgi:Phage capsid family
LKSEYTSDEDKKHKGLKTELVGLDRQIERARDLQEAERSAPAILHHGNLGDGAYEVRVNSASLSTPTWAQVLAFVSAIQGANADIGALAWAMAPRSVAKLRSTVRVSSTDSVMLMETENRLAGYPVAVSTSLSTNDSPDTNTVFGVWSQLLVGYWSGTDILVNPYETTAYAKGRVLVRAMRDTDVAVRHGQRRQQICRRK